MVIAEDFLFKSVLAPCDKWTWYIPDFIPCALYPENTSVTTWLGNDYVNLPCEYGKNIIQKRGEQEDDPFYFDKTWSEYKTGFDIKER